MKHLSIILLALFSTAAVASSDPGMHTQAKAATGCGTLMTAAECVRHLEILAELGADESARQAYLEQHLAVMREREALCACTASQQSLTRAVYR